MVGDEKACRAVLQPSLSEKTVHLAQLQAVVDLVLERPEVDGADEARVHHRLRVQRRQEAGQLAAQ